MKRKSRNRRHLNLLCDISDLAALLTGSENIESFLQSTVEKVVRHMDADVCSIYLYDEKSSELVLSATIGLKSTAIGRIRMKIGEGLVGKIFEKLEPINEGFVGDNPHFKYFKEAGEDRFNSFLAVPILRGIEKIGVLVAQHEKRNFFNEVDVIVLRAITSQLAGAIGNARLLLDFHRQRKSLPDDHIIPETLRFIKGVAVVPGYAFGPASIFYKSHGALLLGDSESDSQYTLKDFHRAVKGTVKELQDLQSKFAERLPESVSLIFTAHQMILKDVRFINKMEKQILYGVSPQAAIRSVAKEYIEFFLSSTLPHIREKADDIRDLVERLLKNLESRFYDDPDLSRNRIVIARELFPSDVLRLVSEDAQGIILVGGGVTSHVSILARSLQLPLIIANRSELLHISEDTPVFMDAVLGNIYVQPTDKIINQIEEGKQTLTDIETLSKAMSSATFTQDGIRIHLFANINLFTDLALARKLKAEGIGLFRTEFPFLIRSSIPSEEEQYFVYKRLFDAMPGQPITIRTLDLGGDKLIAYSDATRETNPELGLKSIRFSLHHLEIFYQQLRAILRAGENVERLRIMFPMISSLDEFKEAKQAVFSCMEQLQRDGFPYHKSPLIGAMFEIPSVLEIIDALVSEADFLSIGTNDFIQYLLAVDRTNVKVADYYRPYHPSVLRSLSKIVRSAMDQEKEISICGEMAHDPKYIPFLLGIGVRSLSVYPTFLPPVQKIIMGLKISDAKAFSQKILLETTISGVRKVLLMGKG